MNGLGAIHLHIVFVSLHIRATNPLVYPFRTGYARNLLSNNGECTKKEGVNIIREHGTNDAESIHTSQLGLSLRRGLPDDVLNSISKSH